LNGLWKKGATMPGRMLEFKSLDGKGTRLHLTAMWECAEFFGKEKQFGRVVSKGK